MDLSNIVMDFLNPSDIPNEKVLDDLWNLSTFKYDVGFSFIVGKDYINQYIKDAETDDINVDYFKELIRSMKTQHLFVKQAI